MTSLNSLYFRSYMFSNSIRRPGTMRRVAGILLILVAPLLALGFQHSGGWIKYDSKEGRYSILLPSQPKVGSQEATTGDGVAFTQYKAAVFGADAAYMIGYFDYTDAMSFTIDKARDEMVAAVKGTLIGEKTVRLGSSLGREIRLLVKDANGSEYDMRARFFDIDRRVYVLQFLALKSADVAIADVKAARYFDSFQVAKPAQN